MGNLEFSIASILPAFQIPHSKFQIAFRPDGAARLYNAPMMLRALVAAVAAAGTLLQPAAVHVLVSNGMKGSIEELRPQIEKAIGRPLAIEFGSTASLKKRIETGEAFDLTIITTEAIDDLIAKGKLTRASRADVGRSELGIGIRAGAPRPDIRTPAALRKALQEAASVTYPQDGASRGTIEKMFERMGIGVEMKPKVILAPGSGAATESVAHGRAAMVITLFSEIVPTKGVEILGPLPGEYRSDIRFAAATSAASPNAEIGKALIAFLVGPGAAPVLKAKGIT